MTPQTPFKISDRQIARAITTADKIGYQLTSDDIAALQRYAAYFGKYWKSILAQDWERAGPYSPLDTRAILQNLRNVLGPSWLDAL